MARGKYTSVLQRIQKIFIYDRLERRAGRGGLETLFLLLPNLYGDIVSDLCAGLIGGLGIAQGANIGEQYAVFEPVHGSAPDIAGMDKANPTAMLMSAIEMLNYIDEQEAGAKIKTALFKTLEDGIKTADLGGTATCTEFTDAIIERL